MYSYGFLIPVLSGYMVWARRKQLAEMTPEPRLVAGGCLLAISLAVLLLGEAGMMLSLQELSFPFALAGMVLAILGFGFLRALLFPIAYLFFMIPVWEVVIDHLHFPLQNFSARNGAALLNIIGIPAYRHGVYIDLPTINLEVAQACSGVNYLIAIIAIGIPLAHLYVKGWRKKCLLVSFAVLIAILANGLRIALIGAFSYYTVGNPLHGPFHVFQGLFVSAVGYGALIVGLLFLTRRSGNALAASRIERGVTSSPAKLSDGRWFRRAAPVVVLLVLAGGVVHFHTPAPIPPRKSLDLFPTRIGEWSGSNAVPVYDKFRTMGVDHELSRIYQTEKKESVHLYIGYFARQDRDRKLISYRTADLHQGASKVEVHLNPHGSIEVNRLDAVEGKEARTYVFWYDLNGRTVTDIKAVKWFGIVDALSRNRSNGAIVLLSVEGGLNHREETISPATEEFIGRLHPLLKEYFS
jgi:EpsI family protein